MPDRSDRSPAMSVLPRRLQGAATLAALLCLTTACQAPLASGPSSSTSTVVSPTGTASGTAAAALVALPVKGRAAKTGYSRKQFGQAWSDDVSVPSGHNGCDQRSDVLRRDLTGVAFKASTRGCVPASGTLTDPYTGRTIHFTRGAATSTAVQIDHVVALSNAWQTGAAQLPADQRDNLAGDPLELLAVDGPTNEAKGDGDAATWLPPNKTFRCAYVVRQIAVKAKYRLWVTAAEKSSMTTVLRSCPGIDLPTELTVAVPAATQLKS